MAFLLGGLLGQNVTAKALRSLKRARGGAFKTLGGTAFGF
jgi:hypothetical protein